MRVLVTGGAGYIGSVCVERLLDAGHEVIVYDNLSEGHRSAVDPRAVWIHAPPSTRDGIHDALAHHRPEAVLHFAAHALVGESMTHPGKYFRNNVADGADLLEAAAQNGVRKFIFSSTCAVYGIPDRIPITEETPRHPINPYGESKLMFEQMLEWYQKLHGIETVAFRYFNAAGATEKFGEHHRVETHLIPNVLEVALGRAPYCKIFGTDYPTRDGTCVRDFIHVIDLADAHIRALEPGLQGTYNLGVGGGSTVREVIQACEKITGRPIPIQEEPRRPGDPPELVASPEKAFRELQWKPQYPDIEQIAKSAWNWHQAHPHGYPD